MTAYALDMHYALARLGLSLQAPPVTFFDAIQAAKAYRLISPARRKEIDDLEAFFKARRLFGPLDLSYETLQKAYHVKAFALHPDRGHHDPAAEEKLKELNVAWQAIRNVNSLAKAYFKLADDVRAAQEKEARQAHLHEKGASAPPPDQPPEPSPEAQPETAAAPKSTAAPFPATPRGAYIAASVPRYIRQARLPQMPVQAIIGARLIGNMAYDIIMLPEKEFAGAMARLAAAEPVGAMNFVPGRFVPAYSPKDRQVFTPTLESTSDEAAALAKAFFLKQFGLDQSN